MKEFDRKLVYIVETHVHADDVTEASALKQVTGTQTSVSRRCGTSGFDQLFHNGSAPEFGGEPLLVFATPGHTPGSSCSLWWDRFLTGDTLPIDGCGHKGFQHGDGSTL